MAAPKTYKGFKYSLISDGLWMITLPSSIRSKVAAVDEAALLAIIDSLGG